jgi:hypothetical protein
MWLATRLVLFLLCVFILPALLTLGWWLLQDRPNSWSSADWSASGVLPVAHDARDAAIYVMAARTGGLKGAFSVHSWIVTKHAGAAPYVRYDKVGWGSPIRRNAYAADGRWYSNEPVIVHAVTGEAAERLIPQVEAAIRAYPYSKQGDYHIWPGPNSNSFVAYVVRSVPELGAQMPPNAVGRDYDARFLSIEWYPQSWDFHATLKGVAGVSLGWMSGIELQFMGLVAGFDIVRPAILVPAFGRVDLLPRAAVAALS